jgi:hypothetical protein
MLRCSKLKPLSSPETPHNKTALRVHESPHRQPHFSLVEPFCLHSAQQRLPFELCQSFALGNTSA